MAIPHAKSAEVIDVRPLGTKLDGVQTSTLVKTDSLEVIRLVLPAGKEIKEPWQDVIDRCTELIRWIREQECSMTA